MGVGVLGCKRLIQWILMSLEKLFCSTKLKGLQMWMYLLVLAPDTRRHSRDMIDGKWLFCLMVYLGVIPWIKGIFTPDWLEAINYPCLFYFCITEHPMNNCAVALKNECSRKLRAFSFSHTWDAIWPSEWSRSKIGNLQIYCVSATFACFPEQAS